MGILQNPAQAPNLGCAIYQGLTSGIPAGLLGSTNDFISEADTYLQNNLLPVLPVSGTRAMGRVGLNCRTCTGVSRTSLVCRRTDRAANSTTSPARGPTRTTSALSGIEKSDHMLRCTATTRAAWDLEGRTQLAG